MRKSLLALGAIIALLPGSARALDTREMVPLDAKTQEDMMIGMRDHLIVLDTVVSHIASERYGEAARLAEQRLDFAPFDPEIAQRIAKSVPPAMIEINTAMRLGVTRFAAAARRADTERSYASVKSLNAALSDITSACNTCHVQFRIR